MVERQERINILKGFPSFSMQEWCAWEIAAHVFKLILSVVLFICNGSLCTSAIP